MYEQILIVLKIIGAAGGAAGTFYSLWRWCMKPILNFFKNMALAPDRLSEIQDELKTIKAELQPNCGMSLRDAINRIENNLLIERHTRRALTMAMDVAVFETDQDGKCVWINHFFTAITGLTIEDAKGYGWFGAIHDDDRDRVSDGWKDAVEEKRALHTTFDMVNIKTDEITIVKCDSFPIANDAGNVVGHVGIITVVSK